MGPTNEEALRQERAGVLKREREREGCIERERG